MSSTTKQPLSTNSSDENKSMFPATTSDLPVVALSDDEISTVGGASTPCRSNTDEGNNEDRSHREILMDKIDDNIINTTRMIDSARTMHNGTGSTTATSISGTAATNDNMTISNNDGIDNSKWYYSIKLYIGLLLLGFIVFVIVDSITNQYIRHALQAFLEWIENNTIYGFFLFVLVYIIATLLFIPGSLLTLGAGFVFSMSSGLGVGILIGTISVFLGASIGAILAFFLGRYLFLEQVRKLSNKYALFEALNAALQTNGLKIMVLLRLSPIIPFSALNYLAGALTISTRDYIVSMLAIIPGTILYVFVGASAGSLADSSNSGMSQTATIIVVVIGVAFGVLAIWLTARYARKELNRIVEERRINNNVPITATDVETGSIPNDLDIEGFMENNRTDLSSEN